MDLSEVSLLEEGSEPIFKQEKPATSYSLLTKAKQSLKKAISHLEFNQNDDPYIDFKLMLALMYQEINIFQRILDKKPAYCVNLE